MVYSVAALVAPPATALDVSAMFTDQQLAGILYSELIVIPVLVVILYFRRWRPADLGLRGSPHLMRDGLLLAGASIAISWMVAVLVEPFFTAAGGRQLYSFDPGAAAQRSIPMILAVSIVNPLFEEIFVCGYVIESLKDRFGMLAAINVSVAIRLTYHLYQGPYAFVEFAIFGLLFAYTYARTRRLWVLIVAHGFLDLIGLL